MSDSCYSGLVNLIRKDIKAADILVTYNDADFITEIAYKTQQILEKTFKLILYSSNNVTQVQIRAAGHNLTKLCKFVEMSGLVVPFNIKSMLRTITSWESLTRYDDTFGTMLNSQLVLGVYQSVRNYAVRVCSN